MILKKQQRANNRMKTIAIILTSLVLLTTTGRSVPSSFQITGTVNQFDIQGFPDLGIGVGKPYHGTLSYELKPGIPEVGGYFFISGFRRPIVPRDAQVRHLG